MINFCPSCFYCEPRSTPQSTDRCNSSTNNPWKVKPGCRTDLDVSSVHIFEFCDLWCVPPTRRRMYSLFVLLIGRFSRARKWKALNLMWFWYACCPTLFPILTIMGGTPFPNSMRKMRCPIAIPQWQSSSVSNVTESYNSRVCSHLQPNSTSPGLLRPIVPSSTRRDSYEKSSPWRNDRCRLQTKWFY